VEIAGPVAVSPDKDAARTNVRMTTITHFVFIAFPP